MSNIVLVHGFNASDGVNSLDYLKPFLESLDHNVIEADYGNAQLLNVRLCNYSRSRYIASLLEGYDWVGIGHSNGCAILQDAADLSGKFKQLLYINPALDNNKGVPINCDQRIVYHSPSDTTVALSKYIPFHKWGNMGQVGYTGVDERNINKNVRDDYSMSAVKHSDVFKPVLRDYFLPIIAGDVVK